MEAGSCWFPFETLQPFVRGARCSWGTIIGENMGAVMGDCMPKPGDCEAGEVKGECWPYCTGDGLKEKGCWGCCGVMGKG